MKAKLISMLIKNCKKCSYVDKPPCIFKIYEKFLPKRLKTLVISESPPPGAKRDYLYNLENNDRLRKVLAKAFGCKEKDVVKLLIKNNVFWTTAIKCRPLSFKNLEEMRKNCLEILKKEIEILKPKRIVVLGKRVGWKSIKELSIKNIEIKKEFHPLYLARFKKERIKKLKDLVFG